LKNPCGEPVYFARTGNELSLSGAAAAKLLKAVIEKGKPFKFKAGGWSMSPFIRDKDIITLSPSLTDFPQKGDVVGVIDPVTEKLLVHRIVGMNNGRYWVKGDGLGKEDPGSFGLNGICGHVTQVERDGKPVWFGVGAEKKAIAVLSQVPLAMRLVSKALGLLRRLNNHKELNQNRQFIGQD
jgi:hypothetical protein